MNPIQAPHSPQKTNSFNPRSASNSHKKPHHEISQPNYSPFPSLYHYSADTQEIGRKNLMMIEGRRVVYNPHIPPKNEGLAPTNLFQIFDTIPNTTYNAYSEEDTNIVSSCNCSLDNKRSSSTASSAQSAQITSASSGLYDESETIFQDVGFNDVKITVTKKAELSSLVEDQRLLMDTYLSVYHKCKKESGEIDPHKLAELMKKSMDYNNINHLRTENCCSSFLPIFRRAERISDETFISKKQPFTRDNNS